MCYNIVELFNIFISLSISLNCISHKIQIPLLKILETTRKVCCSAAFARRDLTGWVGFGHIGAMRHND